MPIFEFDSNPIIFESRFYVTGLSNKYLPAICKFHNIHHTLNVVQYCYELGEHYVLTKTAMEKLLLAAWFHDTGYCLSIDNHENESVTVASTFLESHNVTDDCTFSVNNLILAAKRLQEPVTLAEQIISDADSTTLVKLLTVRRWFPLINCSEQSSFLSISLSRTSEAWLLLPHGTKTYYPLILNSNSSLLESFPVVKVYARLHAID